MPLDLPNDFKIEKNKDINSPIYLYSIIDFDGVGSDLNFCAWGDNVTFDDVEYTAFPISHNEVGENSQGEIDSVKVTVSNISRVIQSYLEEYDFSGKKCRIRQVWSTLLADADNKLDFIYFIDSYTADQNVVEFLLLPKTDVLALELPNGAYTRNYCRWRFKGDECGYAGGETVCNRSKQRCKELGNFRRFGGFPSVPSQSIYVA